MTMNAIETARSRPGQTLLPATLPWAAVIAVLFILPLAFPGTAMVSTLNYLGTMAIFALSYNVLLGQTGLLSLGHATFFGLGGFIATHALLGMAEAGWAFPLPLLPLIGGLGAFVLGIFGGWLASGKGGMPFAMITLGLSELVYAAAAIFPSIYGSEEGVSMDRMELGSSFGMDYGSATDIYVIVAVWFVICAAGLKYFTTTPLGLLANAVRDNAERVEFLGFSARRVRMWTYAIAAGVAGIAGSLAAINFEIITVIELGAATSTLVLLMTYIGGTRVFFGPVLGAVVIGLMKVWLSDLTPAWMLYFGLLFIFVVMVAPGGLAGILVGAGAMIRAGRLGPQLPLLAAIGGLGLLSLAGVIMLIELGYRAGLDAALGSQIRILGLPMDAHGLNSWGLAALLALGGALSIRPLLSRLETLQHRLGLKGGDPA
ncbi:branched-chain amino acid ABC transporter permease [Pseudooceanicola sp. CBS1P-1]|uniref:Branched-chain amino acid ABC transporter permease n=1 Tax=Pseudooceanicola albus TaxID=2692189 RepID=A0A6L7G816_9RHOB|nr:MULTISPECIES: branched-chain amino acid ABC transporter permease [Pseudooceanicola]MBT9386023.1 branched-chain amino acid ABC transporter permease [Pseudooceanicola endophyticus]MXN19556.1 branched-chain amino acid ABC transporter permease [Pseudooceanicola albus]